MSQNLSRGQRLACCVLGGQCLADAALHLDNREARFYPMEQCFELMLGPDQVADYLAEGVHLLTPGMVKDWIGKYQQWDFNDCSARAFFAESTSRLLLLDTGVDPEAPDALEAFAGKCGVPWERHHIGLDSVRLFVRALVAEWRVNEQKALQANQLAEKERELADYAMVNDLISGITALTDESSVVERVLEMFAMFCGPQRVIYLPISEQGYGKLAALPPLSSEADIPVEAIGELASSYEVDQKRDGFTLAIERQGVRFGVVSVKGITFPQYLQHYLNLSLTITPVLALALSNARTFQKQVEAEQCVKGLNQQLQQKLVAVNALNKELEAFTYSVSHDLRAPLRSLDGFSQILVRDYPEQLDDKGKHLLSRIEANAERMGQLIDDMLHLSRLSRGEITLADVSLTEIATEIVDDLQNREDDREAEFIIGEGITASCDAGLIKVVLENFLGNAWKYTSKESHTRIEFGTTVADDEPVFYIRDNGAGFDMAYADRLFRPFQRLHSDEEYQGTGIGLATVQRIIQRHGGRLWAEGDPGKGATFYFTLPDYPPDSAIEPVASA